MLGGESTGEKPPSSLVYYPDCFMLHLQVYDSWSEVSI